MTPLCNSVCKLSVTLWFTLLSFTTFSQKSPIGRSDGSGRGAIIIGISHYQHLDSLQFAHRDAAAFAQFLKTQNVPDDNIKLFINQDATRFNIVDEIYNLTQKLQKGDKFFFYFTGHGDLEAKIGYENSLLLLHGCGAKNYFQGTEYLQLSELRTWFGELTKKGVEVIFIADACHSGGLIGGKEGLDKTQRALQESWAGITKILSSQANEFSLEGKQWGGGRGIFSYFLVNGLTGQADANKDKKVSLKELDNYLKKSVLRGSLPNIQTPIVEGNQRQIVSNVNSVQLALLQNEVQTNFSTIIQDVNFKAQETKLLSQLDTTLVHYYKKFNEAIEVGNFMIMEDKNNKECAEVYYQKLMANKIPLHISQILKRTLTNAIIGETVQSIVTVASEGRARPTMPYGYFKIVQIYIDKGIEIIGTNHPSTPQLLALKKLYWSIENLSNVEKQTKIKQELLALTKNDPNYPHYQVLLGHLYTQIKQLDSAVYYFERCKILLPNQAYPYINIGRAYAANNKREEGERYYQKAIEIDSTNSDAYFGLANLLGLQGKYDKFIIAAEKTITLTRNNSQLPFETQWGNCSKRYNSLDMLLRTYHRFLGDTNKVWTAIQRYEKAAKEDNNENYPHCYLWAVNKLSHVLSYDSTQRWQKQIFTITDRLIGVYVDSLVKFNTEKETQTYKNIILGAYHRYKGENEVAEKYYLKGLDLNFTYAVLPSYMPKSRKLAAFWVDTVEPFLELCILAIEKKNLQEALKWLEKSITKGCKRKDLYQSPYIIPELHGLAEYKALMTKYFPPTEKK